VTAGPIAIARGGTSIEREVSLRGARRVMAALRGSGQEIVEIEIDHTVVERVRELIPEFVFIVAHGQSGEDGSLQALLELLDVPYTGSDSLASQLCLDKIVTKQLLRRAGLTTPPFHAFSRHAFQDLGAASLFDKVMERLGAPAALAETQREEVERAALAACRTLGTRDMARVDLILEPSGAVQILELNTIPGLTETGPTPLAAEAAGIGFTGLVERLADAARGRATSPAG
jgi:D-alanine-D-alanine ligase-like ATP-grasp enzyme